MTRSELLLSVVRPCLAWMGPRYEGPEAEVMLVAISTQEDAACARCQDGGPARGLFQFESAGVFGVIAHPRSQFQAWRCCAVTDLALLEESAGLSVDRILARFETDDRLACAFARLLLWTDPRPLPPLGRPGDAYALYRSLWRPGRPRPLDWPNSHGSAVAAVTAA